MYLASIAFHRFNTFDFAVIRTAITPLQSLLFNWSVTLVRSFCLRFHFSSSLRGPANGSNLRSKQTKMRKDWAHKLVSHKAFRMPGITKPLYNKYPDTTNMMFFSPVKVIKVVGDTWPYTNS